jgi:hypothetical protein
LNGYVNLANHTTMRCFLLSFILALGFFNSSAQVLDAAPSGHQNILAVEGGGIPMKIDSTTPLDSLIARLKGHWRLIETGKAYWIGYTNDMFSIAARGDSCIQPLLDLIEANPDSYVTYGAVYTLHLLGIDRRIAGRFYEEFTNVKARKALLSLLKYPNLHEQVVALLVRDPWVSDIPVLIQRLFISITDCGNIIKGLNCYYLPSKDVPVDTMRLFPPDAFERLVKIQNGPAIDIIKLYLKVCGITDPDSIYIEHSLLEKWGSTGYYDAWAFNDPTLRKGEKNKFLEGVVDAIRGRQEVFDMGGWLLGDESDEHYYIRNGKLYVCSAYTARNKWREWWLRQTEEQKKKYNYDMKFYKVK